MTSYFHSILETDLPTWSAIGWVEVARERKPSVACACVLVRWCGGGNPRLPK